MKKIGIAYSNLWGHSAAFGGNYILECFPYLRGHYSFTLTDKPDFAFFSVYGYIGANRYDGAVRFVYAGEPGAHFAMGGKMSPGVWEPGFFHYGITCDSVEESPNHRYMPQGFLHLQMYNDGTRSLIRDGRPAQPKKFFADFVCSNSNGNSRYRIDFFHKLSAYKRIESCGHVERNNNALRSAAYSREGYLLKQAFQAQCKFSIAMENTVFATYVTEKLTDPLVARSVPIYWGAPNADRYFNPEAFINVQKFASDEEAIEHIKRVDQDDALYQAYLNAPPFRGNVVPTELSDEHYLAFFKSILG